MSANVITHRRYLRSLREWVFILLAEERTVAMPREILFRISIEWEGEQVIFSQRYIYIHLSVNTINRWKFKRDEEFFFFVVSRFGRAIVSVC